MSDKVDPRVTRTRQAIEAAFVALWSAKPLHAITVRDITDHAHVNRVTFYAHFRDKYELCDATVQSAYEDLLAQHLPSAAALTQANFRQMVQATLAFMVDLRRGCLAASEDFAPYVMPRVQGIFRDRLMAWIQPDYLITGCEAGAEVTATAMSGAVIAVAARLAEQRRTTVSVEVVTEELVKTLARGLWQSLADYQPTIWETT